MSFFLLVEFSARCFLYQAWLPQIKFFVLFATWFFVTFILYDSRSGKLMCSFQLFSLQVGVRDCVLWVLAVCVELSVRVCRECERDLCGTAWTCPLWGPLRE